VVLLEKLRFQSSKAQASFEFLVVLAIVLMVVSVFVSNITEEYTDSFVLASVKNVINSEISQSVLKDSSCAGGHLSSIQFSKVENKITVNIVGCSIDLVKTAGVINTGLCGARSPTGGLTFVCSGTIYTLSQV